MSEGERISFDRSLYLPEAVAAAAAAYSDHARIALTPMADAVVVDVCAVAPDEQRTVVKAFCNHVLYETITRHRQAELTEVA
jgi:hypothetical protein